MGSHPQLITFRNHGRIFSNSPRKVIPFVVRLKPWWADDAAGLNKLGSAQAGQLPDDESVEYFSA